METETGLLCAECRDGLLQMKPFPGVEHIDGVLFFFSYENSIKTAIQEVKFSHDKNQAYLLAEEAEKLFHQDSSRNIIMNFLAEAGTLPLHDEFCGKSINKLYTKEKTKENRLLWSGIPTDPERLRKRGFDLPSLLFAEQAQACGGVWQRILCRTRKTLPMYGLGPEERIRNLQDCFAAVRDVRGKSVILVDDIFTTGTTFSAAAEVLKKAGAVSVKGMAFCGSVENLR
ncbi:MAG: ComF family protein [Acidaminococcaceae bacterium]|nr:ComF family protein [Acidaminococcaceae bacterium]